MIVYRNPERDTYSRCDSLGGKFKSVRNLGKLSHFFTVILKMACFFRLKHAYLKIIQNFAIMSTKTCCKKLF